MERPPSGSHPRVACCLLLAGCAAAPAAAPAPGVQLFGAPHQALAHSEHPIDMVLLPGGSFTMGSPEGEGYQLEHPAHQVTVAPFYMAALEVTTAQWALVNEQERGDQESGSRPVEKVTWCAALRFANALSSREEGLRPVYHLRDCEAGDQVTWVRSRRGYRLPTEAEWEYAARAGSDSAWSCGDQPECLEQVAWVAVRGNPGVHPVGEKQPNAWGLYDLHGNVWEWTWDPWSAYGSQDEPDPARRAVRGGGAWYVPDMARSAFRYPRAAGQAVAGQGLRLALDPPPGTGGG